jgi:hypothetical protein
MIKLLDMLREISVASDIDTDIFLKRIPFLKTFKNFSDNKRVHFQKVDFNANKKAMFGDELVIFPQVNTVMDFYYSKDQIRDNYFHNFTLKFELILMPPKDMDTLTSTILMMANKMNNKKYSYRKEIISTSEILTPEELNGVINEINGKFFAIEEYVENLHFDIKNPLA